MPKYPQRFWLVALALAWAEDFLIWEKSAGISLFLWVLLALAGGYLLAWFEGVRPARRSFLLSALLLIAAGLALVRSAPFPRFINMLIALGGLLLLIRTFHSGGWTHYGAGGYLFTGLETMWFGLTRALSVRLAPPAEAGGGRGAVRQVLPVLRGLLLALPVVMLFAALLASADLVFAQEIDRLVQAFSLERWPEYFFRFLIILMLAYVLAGLYAQAVRPLRWLVKLPGDSPALPERIPPARVETAADGSAGVVEAPAAAQGTDTAPPKPLPEAEAGSPLGRFLGATETLIVLGSVDALFLAFVAVQFRYFFGGQANITTAGFTYSEYARRGFFELVTVAVFALLLYMILNAVSRRNSALVEQVFTVLSTLLVGAVLVILVSAFQRLTLYEDVYGFTRLRMQTHILIPWLGVLLVGTVLLQILRRSEWWGALIAVVAFGFAATFGVLNVDGLIARLNIQRALGGAALDGAYLLELSDDALPQIARAYRDSSTPEPVRDTLGAVLACKAFFQGREEPQPWQSYHPGRAVARQALVGLDLSQYIVNEDGHIDSVAAYGGSFYCYGGSLMD